MSGLTFTDGPRGQNCSAAAFGGLSARTMRGFPLLAGRAVRGDPGFKLFEPPARAAAEVDGGGASAGRVKSPPLGLAHSCELSSHIGGDKKWSKRRGGPACGLSSRRSAHGEIRPDAGSDRCGGLMLRRPTGRRDVGGSVRSARRTSGGDGACHGQTLSPIPSWN